jgi:tol-pal system-associated acyl-CoA thioesterase
MSIAPAHFQWPLRVYIEDTDAGGIVYYVNYLKFMERARTEFMRSLGFGKSFIFNSDRMFVVNSVNSEYLKPAKLDDQLIATAKVVTLGRANLTLEQLVYRDNELLCRGEVKLVCVDRQTVKPQRIPKELLTILQSQ